MSHILENLVLTGYQWAPRLQVMDDIYDFCFYKLESVDGQGIDAGYYRLNLRFGPNWHIPVVKLIRKADMEAYAAWEEELIAAADAAEEEWKKREIVEKYGDFFSWMFRKPKPLIKGYPKTL